MVKRPSSIDRMDPEVRDWIGRLRDQGRTLDEIIAKLRELDVEALPSRSALHRHLQKVEEVARDVRQSRAVAEALVRNLGEAPEKVTRLNIELMHHAMMDIVTAAKDDNGRVTLDPMQVMLLSKSLDHLGKASKDDVARTVAIEKRAAEKAKAQAVTAMTAVAKKAGLSAERVEELRDEFLNLADKPK